MPPKVHPDLPLTAKVREVVEIVAAAGSNGILKERVHQKMYMHREDGGPHLKIIDVLICKANKELRKQGMEVRAHMGICYYESVDAPTHNLTGNRIRKQDKRL